MTAEVAEFAEDSDLHAVTTANGDVRPAERQQPREGGKHARIRDVAAVVQDVHIRPHRPHLRVRR